MHTVQSSMARKLPVVHTRFPLREHYAIVCGEQCWTELTAAALSAGGPAPTRETHTTKRKVGFFIQ